MLSLDGSDGNLEWGQGGVASFIPHIKNQGVLA